jgi:uncharacterized membrane protein
MQRISNEERGEPTFEKNVGAVERLASVSGGAALAAYGLSRQTPAGAALALLGGALVVRGATGHCPVYGAAGIDTTESGSSTRSSLRASDATRVEHSVTINRAPGDLYAVWRDLTILPQFMKNLVSVERLDDGRSKWRAKGPLGTTVEWEAEIVNDVANELLAWRSLEGSEVANAGSVRFLPQPPGRGTVVKVEMEYDPVGGVLSDAVAMITGTDPQAQIEEDMRRFKCLMEAGEIPTTAGQSHGGPARANDEEVQS